MATGGRSRDVVVVGAGPAGTTAARVVAEAGYEVTVVDRKQVVGEPNHCGEALAVECLREIGAVPPQPWIHRTVKGAQAILPNGCRLSFPREGYCIDRPAFDLFLSDRARAAGAEVLTSVKVRSMEADGRGWTLRTSDGELETRYLIGAGGPRCPVARRVAGRMPTVGAIQYKLRVEDCPRSVRDDWLRFYFDDAFRGGYAWVFDRGKEVSIGAGAAGPVKETLDTLCRRLGIDPGRRFETAGGALPSLVRPQNLLAERALLCGDAGGFTYPLTKGGIHGAVWSGRLAGETVVDALRKGKPSRLRRYPGRVRRHPCRSRWHLSVSQRALDLDDSVLEIIGSIMDGKVYTEVPVRRCLDQLARQPTGRAVRAIAVGLATQLSYARAEIFAW